MRMLNLTSADQDRLRAAYQEVSSPHTDPHGVLTSLYSAFGVLRPELLRELLLFARDPASPGCMLLQGLPIDDALPETPASGQLPSQHALEAEKSLLGLAQLMGTPVGYLTEKDGRLIHHVVPMQGGEYTQSNRGSKVFLTYHNDSMYDASMVFNSHNPDFLLLLCLRADHEGQASTLYADAREICAELPAPVLDVLRQPRFRMAAPSNYTLLVREARENEKLWSAPVSVLTGPPMLPEIYIAANGVQALDPSAESALAELLEACERLGARHCVQLRPGDTLLINNRKGVHARTQFQPRYDGRDRWLLRANIRTSLWTIRDRATDQALVFA